MHRVHRALRVALVNQNGHADLGGGNHVDVDVVVVEGLEHLGRHAGVGHHAGSHDGHLGYVSAAGDALAAQAAHIVLDELHRGVRVVAGYGEGDILAVLTADGLQDYIHVDIFLCQQIEESERHARLILQTDN